MFNHFKISTRLLILLGVALAALLALSIYSASFSRGVKNDLEIFSHDILEKGEYLSELNAIFGNRIPTLLYQMSTEETPLGTGFDLIHKENRMAAEVFQTFATAKAYLQNNEDALKQRQLLQQFSDLTKKFDDALRALEQSAKNNKEAVRQFLSHDLFTFTLPLDQTLEEIDKIYTKDAKEDFKYVMEDIFTFDLIRYGVITATIIILILLFYLIFRSIVSPLSSATDNIKKLAKGDTDITVSVSSGGEIGVLERAMEEMIDSSVKMGGALKHIAQGDLSIEVAPRSDRDILGKSLTLMLSHLQMMIGKIQEGINTLASSCQETMTSVSQLSAGAAETATAVTETTTTIEELKQTSIVAAEKAKDVLQNAEQTNTTVQESEKTVYATIQDMKQIQERMQIISDSILKLSEKSLAIGEVMNTVNDIAEQSNTLAVNAAIEATKAGEQGRGFGIVAQEIRSLAEQSKGATVQVRALLNEIQAATNAAVLATEQGSKAVIKGVEQSTSINTAIKTLGEKMTGVTQAANQIVYSSQQQMIGIEQVTVAMTNINQATNQHLDHLRQIETAVSNLNEVGADLKEVTDQYKLKPKKIG